MDHSISRRDLLLGMGACADGAFSYTASDVTEGAQLTDTDGKVIDVISVGEQLPLSPRIKWSLGAEYGFRAGDSERR